MLGDVASINLRLFQIKVTHFIIFIQSNQVMIMNHINRRCFLKTTAGLLATPALLSSASGASKSNEMDRIGMTTVVYRARFEATKDKNSGPLTNALTLAEIPEFYADRFKIHNIEFWSKHFESQEKSYLDTIKDAVAKTNSKLTNLQIDSSYNLATDKESQRNQSINLIKQWIDVAAYLGMSSVRANCGSGKVETAIQSLKLLNEYAKSKNIMMLAENHGGISMQPDTLMKIIQSVDSPNLRGLPDFGNYPNNEVRYPALKALMPYAHLISAKVFELNEKGQHPAYDYGKCLKIAEENGFKGIYSIEQWTPKPIAQTQEEIVDWAIQQIQAAI
ncbi:MAG: hypothetical protein COA78_13010 [Blastopirellula sp.]|nr:MAG: hypothetical protein COA78_13010 [Blastopirellula sp.]